MSPAAASRPPRPRPPAARAPVAPAQIAPLGAWRPIILDACSKHTPTVLAIACLLRGEGPRTTREIMTELGQTQRDRIDRATALGRKIGLFTCAVGARNLQRFAVVSTPPPRPEGDGGGVGGVSESGT